MSRVEATFIKHFANGNHREGMKCLRPKAKREKHRVTYFLGTQFIFFLLNSLMTKAQKKRLIKTSSSSTGFLSGCAVALAIAITVLIHIRGITKSEGRHQYMENIFPLYRFVIITLYIFIIFFFLKKIFISF